MWALGCDLGTRDVHIPYMKRGFHIDTYRDTAVDVIGVGDREKIITAEKKTGMTGTANQGSSVRAITDNQLLELRTAVTAKNGNDNKPSQGFHRSFINSNIKGCKHELNAVLTPREQGEPREK